MKRIEVIIKQLRRAHVAGNKSMPTDEAELAIMVNDWSDLLKSLETEQLAGAFANAIIDCRYSVPSVKEVLQGHKKTQENKFNRVDWVRDDQKSALPSRLTQEEIKKTTEIIRKYPQFKGIVIKMSVGDMNQPPAQEDHKEFCELIAGMFS